MIDICVTELIKNPEPYEPNFGAHKWSTVAQLDCFNRIRLWAESAYEYMTVQGHFVPEITRHGVDGIVMIWTSDEQRIVTIIIEPDQFSYRWGRQGVKLPTYVNVHNKIPHMLDLFSRYLNRSIEVTHGPNGSDFFSVGCGSRQERGSGEVGSSECGRDDSDRAC